MIKALEWCAGALAAAGWLSICALSVRRLLLMRRDRRRQEAEKRLRPLIAWRGITGHRREQRYAALEEAFASPLTPPISILLPAYNEETGIVESVRSLLRCAIPGWRLWSSATDRPTRRSSA